MINISNKSAYFIKLEVIYLFLSLFIGGIKAYEYDLAKGINVFLYVFAFMQIVIVLTNFKLIFKRDS